MKRKIVATALRMRLNCFDKDPDIDRLCHQAELYGTIYLALSEVEVKKIFDLGYTLRKKGDYYLFSAH